MDLYYILILLEWNDAPGELVSVENICIGKTALFDEVDHILKDMLLN